MRMGVDVGGTNTDAVLMDGTKVVGWFKTPTTPDVTTSITTAMKTVLEQTKIPADRIKAVMIGTTHFTNAVVETKEADEDRRHPAGAAGHRVFAAHGGLAS